MPSARKDQQSLSAAGKMEAAVAEVLRICKTARRNSKSLTGDNSYADRFALQKAEAINAFRDLSGQTAGDVSAIAELIEKVFAPSTPHRQRTALARELTVAIRTTSRNAPPSAPTLDQIFPSSILEKTKRGYLVSIGKQMNGCFAQGYYDAVAVMMRRLLEVVIIEAFEANSIAAKITGPDGNYLQLTDLISSTLTETTWHLERHTKRHLPKLRDLGHQSAHGRRYTATKDDILINQSGIRTSVEEFLHLAKLL